MMSGTVLLRPTTAVASTMTATTGGDGTTTNGMTVRVIGVGATLTTANAGGMTANATESVPGGAQASRTAHPLGCR